MMGLFPLAVSALSSSIAEVYLFRCSDVASSLDSSFLEPVLAPEEIARVRQFGSLERCKQFCSSRMILRKVLSEKMGVPPKDIRLKILPSGKPVLDSGYHERSLKFSLSHSEDLGMVAISTRYSVGIDIQKVEENGTRDLEKRLSLLIERYFSPSDKIKFDLDDDSKKFGVKKFYKIWSQKEALAKAFGVSVLRVFQTKERFKKKYAFDLETSVPQGYVGTLVVV